MRKYLIIFIILALFPIFVFAENPSVASFTASPSTANSGDEVTFSWQLQNAGGYSFLVKCITGVKFRTKLGGIFACDNKNSSVVITNDIITLVLWNISGGTRTVIAKLIPKDAFSQDYEAAAKEISVSLATLSEPITSFTAPATTTQSGVPITVSWTSKQIDGVNILLECRDEIKVTSPSYGGGHMPCGTPIFLDDLSPAGSITLNFTNSSLSSILYRLTLLPAIISKTYDGTHAAYLDLGIASDIIPDPLISYFTASSTLVDSDKSVPVAWTIDNAKGANLKISCSSSLSVTSSKNPGVTLPCGEFAFTNALAARDAFSLNIKNKSQLLDSITITLFPSSKIGEYDAVRSKSLTISVRPPTAISIPVTVAPTQLAPAIASVSSPAPQSKDIARPYIVKDAKTKAVFTLVLRRGSRGAEVTALQEFLKSDPVIYPEGIVSGYFGALTEQAVKRFQTKYGIVSSGSPATTGYGLVGPKTRAKLNESQ